MNIGRRSFFQRISAMLTVPAIPVKTVGVLTPTNDPPIDLPPDDEIWFADWQAAPRIPIRDSEEPKERRLLRALLLQEPVDFIYFGGTAAGMPRRVKPALLYRVDGYKTPYMTGYCELQKETRTFRLDRIRFVEPAIGANVGDLDSER